MRILVTGAAGFIGLNVVEQALGRGDDVVALSLGPLPPVATAAFAGRRGPAGEAREVAAPGRLTVVTADVRDAAALRRLLATHRPAGVVHAAAQTPGPGVDPARATTIIDVNVAGTAALLRAAHEAGVARVVLTSSSAVYGDAPFGTAPVTEDTEPTPSSLYGFTKLTAERLAVQARAVDGLDVIRARLTAIFGPWEHDTGVRDTLSPPLQIAQAALSAGGGDGDGGATTLIADAGSRDWTHSTDVARALLLLLDAKAPQHDVYNLAVGATWHPERLCRALAARIGGWSWQRVGDGTDAAAPTRAPTIAYNDRLDRPRRSPPSAARFIAEFGPVFRPVGQSVDAYADWAVANRAAVVPAIRPSTTADSRPLPDR